MKKIVFNILGSFIFITSVFYSCKKEKGDNSPPEITFISPYDGQQYNVFDTAQVKFTITDNNQITSATLTLVNSSYTPVMQSVNITIYSSNINQTLYYLLNDVHLESGVYYFKISASDGYNFVNKFQKINITEAPLKTKKYFFATNISNNTSLYKIDSAYNVNVFATYTGDFLKLNINSYTQQVYTSGKNSGDFFAIDAASGLSQWIINNPNTQTTYFTDIASFRNNVFIAEYNFIAKAYNAIGTQQYTYNFNNGFYPVKLFKHNEILITEAVDLILNNRKLIVYDIETGAGIQENNGLSMEVTNIFSIDNNNVILFGNNGNQSQIKIYSITNNAFSSPHTLPNGKITSAAQVDANTFIIAHSDGNLYRYTYQNNSLLNYLNSVLASKIIFDAAENRLLICKNNQIFFHDYASTTLIQTITASDTIRDVGVLYNR